MTWHIVQCQSGKETGCVALLARKGYPGGWFPEERVERRRRAGNLRWHESRPVVTGYVFVQCEDIEVYPINSHEGVGVRWMRVVAPGGKPYRVTDAMMAQMKLVPKRLRELADEIARLEAEAAALRRPVIGGQARITGGALADFTGEVLSIRGGEVAIDAGAMLGFVKVPEGMVERVA